MAVQAPTEATPRELARALAAARFNQRTRLARRDLAEFAVMTVRDDHGRPLDLAPMHMTWIAHVNYCWERNLKCMILAHYGSGKSSSLACPLVAFKLGGDPNLRVKIVTNDDANATKRVIGIANIIEAPLYKHLFPNTRRGDKWTDHELYLRRSGNAIDPSVQARGVITTGIGGRADLIVFDDVVDQRNSTDEGQRRKILDTVERTWLSRLEPDAKVLWIATVWHQADATHQLMQRPGWCTLVQRVSEDCASIEQELLGAPDPQNYPQIKTPPGPNI